MIVSKSNGVSLLEVLISIFVLSIGLLGVAALIPVGRHAIEEAAKSDRAAACGQAILNDIKVRGMLRPHDWRKAGDNAKLGVVPDSAGQYKSERRGLLHGESYAIDPTPLGSTEIPNFNDFPYNPITPGTPLAPGPPGLSGRWTRIQRVSWVGLPLNQLFTSAVFGWRDDLIIQVPPDETQRPRQLFVTYNGGIDALEFPIVPAPSGNPLPLSPDNTGNYSWMVTVTPSSEGHDFVHYAVPGKYGGTPPHDNLPYSYSANTPVYTVSVVVFYKRDTTAPDAYDSTETPGERQVYLQWLGTGLGGGDVRLFAPPARPQYLDVKKNEWMMVSGGYPYNYSFDHDADSSTPPFLRTIPIGVHKWYRIVVAGETTSEDLDGSGTIDPPLEQDYNNNGMIDFFREVTLAGPDWNPRWGDWYGAGGVGTLPDGEPDLVLATLLNGVIGVYTTTIEME
jgi:hypothetical protein